MTESETAILRDLLAYAETLRAYPDARAFRVRHEQRRAVIDDLIDAGHIITFAGAAGPGYALSIRALNALNDSLASEILDDASCVLAALQQQYRQNPQRPVQTPKLAPEVGDDLWRVERALRVVLSLPVTSSYTGTADGRVDGITLAESVLDVTPAAIRRPDRGVERAPSDVRSRVLLRSLTLTRFLSFGAVTHIPLGPLNVLVGANGSGKSNVLAAISLLHAAPTTFTGVLNEGGGARAWIWKGRWPSDEGPLVSPGYPADAVIETVTSSRDDIPGLRYRLGITAIGQQSEITEHIEISGSKDQPDRLVYGYEDGRRVLDSQGIKRALGRRDIAHDRSILAQRRDPNQLPEITALAEAFEQVHLYREWDFGPSGSFRNPARADLQTGVLREDGDNGVLVLHRLMSLPESKERVLYYLRALADGIDDYTTEIQGNTVQLFLRENGYSVPAMRLSDGTLRYLMLIAVLLNPSPPPLICIEEPELGMHPDILPTIADLLVEASARTQIIITTHSDILLDAIKDPAALLLFDKVDGQTRVTRGDSESTRAWLEKFSLGRLWLDGELGGKRW